MKNAITYLIQNKRQIARGLYLVAALLEHLPDGRLPKLIRGVIVSSRPAKRKRTRK